MTLKSKTFTNGLIVKHRKSAIIFENKDGLDGKDYNFVFSFSDHELRSLFDYLMNVANEAWSNITPKEATSEASDYWEYYDRTCDNNGYLWLNQKEIKIEAPNLSKHTLYQFNKAKIQSFLYDLNKQLEPTT